MININPICNIFYLCQEKQKPGLYLKQADNELLNMFFHRCSYKISCSSELAYNISVLALIFWTASEALVQVIVTETDENSLKVIFTQQFLTKASYHFLLFWCILCAATPNIRYFKFTNKNISKYGLCFQTICFLWLWCQEFRWILSFL